MSDWISIKDRLPKDEGLVFIRFITDYRLDEKKPFYTCAHFQIKPCFFYSNLKEVYDKIDDGRFISQYSEVTHWMPLPDKPKEKSNEGK